MKRNAIGIALVVLLLALAWIAWRPHADDVPSDGSSSESAAPSEPSPTPATPLSAGGANSKAVTDPTTAATVRIRVVNGTGDPLAGAELRSAPRRVVSADRKTIELERPLFAGPTGPDGTLYASPERWKDEFQPPRVVLEGYAEVDLPAIDSNRAVGADVVVVMAERQSTGFQIRVAIEFPPEWRGQLGAITGSWARPGATTFRGYGIAPTEEDAGAGLRHRGDFVVDEAGTYEIRLHYSVSGRARGERQEVTVEPSSARTIEVAFRPEATAPMPDVATATFVVREANGTPVEGATLGLVEARKAPSGNRYWGAIEGRFTTDAAGEVSARLPLGQYRYTVEKTAKFPTGNGEFELRNDARIDVILRASGPTLRVEVTEGLQADELAFVWIYARLPGSTWERIDSRALSKVPASLEFTSLPGADHVLVLSGDESAHEVVPIDPLNEAPSRVVLERGDTIELLGLTAGPSDTVSALVKFDGPLGEFVIVSRSVRREGGRFFVDHLGRMAGMLDVRVEGKTLGKARLGPRGDRPSTLTIR